MKLPLLLLGRPVLRPLAPLCLIGLAATLPAGATVLASFENDAEGWTINTGENASYSIAGYSTATGVTDGSYSIEIIGTASPSYGQLLVGPSSTGLTDLLEDSATISIQVTTDAGFGFGTQWSAIINNADLGYTSLDGFGYSGFVGPSSSGQLSWSLTPAQRATLATSSAESQIIFQVGGGDGGTMWLDQVETTAVPEPATGGLLGLTALALAGRRRRPRR